MPSQKTSERIALILQNISNSNQAMALMLSRLYEHHADKTITTVEGLTDMRRATESALRSQKHLSSESLSQYHQTLATFDRFILQVTRQSARTRRS